MCIIAAKPVGIAMPTDEIIENMWYGNSDGAGFMYAENGAVHIRKGFMTYEKFRKALDEFCSVHDPVKTALVMHFRITTHGGTKPENCHPFPITDSIGLLTKSEVKAKVGVAHNGIIDITPRKGISDTMEYIISQLSPLYKAVPDFYRNKHLIEMISNATRSRLAFMDEKGNIFTVGDFIEDDGIKYSNSSYKGWSRWSSCSWGYEGWDDDYLQTDIGSGHFAMKSLMWLDENFGYIITEDGDFLDPTEDMFCIDKAGTLYTYSYTMDAMKPFNGTAFTYEGLPLNPVFDEDKATLEYAYVPDYKAFTPVVDRTSSGNLTASTTKSTPKKNKWARSKNSKK